MIETFSRGTVITDHVLNSISLLRGYISNYNKDTIHANSISQELMSLRRSWRELITYLDELDNNVNEDLTVRIKDLELSINECWEKIITILNISSLSKTDTKPAFELFIRYRKEDISTNLPNELTNLSDELLKNMEIDLAEKVELEAKLHEYIREYTKMFYELEMLKRRTEDLIQKVEPLCDIMANIKNSITESQNDTDYLKSYDILIKIPNSLKPIYIFFYPIIIRNKRIESDENVMDIDVNEYGQISVLFNKPMSNIIKGSNSQCYSEFLSLFFPIKLTFSKMSFDKSTDLAVVSAFIHGDKLIKFHIFSDLLFEGDIGDYICSIDNHFTEEELTDFNCGIPYYWIQFIINNRKVIPINTNDINIKTNDIYKIIDLRIQNFVFFNFILYLISKSPNNFINFISEFLGNGKLGKKSTCNLQEYDITKTHLMSEFSFTFTLENRKYEVSINFSGNISYKIRKDKTSAQGSFVNNGGDFTDILKYNQDLSLNFCRDLIRLL